ncbi:MAG: hypothetical protein JSU63_08230 [Phycisphaerales bacterium]|nr:MAG: hypothetical protein JSU63_08230 [Phycisphaerales bacterium]
MSAQLMEVSLRDAVQPEGFIKGGDASCAEGLKYDFRLGTRILFSGEQPIDTANLSEHERGQLALPPGHLAFVMTEERLELPDTIKAELSLKRKLSHLGILVLGGFCVDPGYRGRLIFGLYNLSSSPFPLMPGRKLVAAQFFELPPDAIPAKAAPPEPLDDFPDDLVRFMLSYAPISQEGIRESIDEIKKGLDDLRQQFHSREEWFTRFQGLLGDLGADLKAEAENRRSTEDEFRKTLTDIQRRTAGIAATIAIVCAIAVAIASGIVLQKIPTGGTVGTPPAVRSPADAGTANTNSN